MNIILELSKEEKTYLHQHLCYGSRLGFSNPQAESIIKKLEEIDKISLYNKLKNENPNI